MLHKYKNELQLAQPKSLRKTVEKQKKGTERTNEPRQLECVPFPQPLFIFPSPSTLFWFHLFALEFLHYNCNLRAIQNARRRYVERYMYLITGQCIVRVILLHARINNILTNQWQSCVVFIHKLIRIYSYTSTLDISMICSSFARETTNNDYLRCFCWFRTFHIQNISDPFLYAEACC